jgi:bifunctional DNA-binding transcriptional regulator/antitoxin component of YhaV-PrlF toxin-antitoxin module
MRRQLDIKPGDDVDFVMEEKATYVNVVKRKSILDFYGILKDEIPDGVADMTAEEMDEAVGQAIAENVEREMENE